MHNECLSPNSDRQMSNVSVRKCKASTQLQSASRTEAWELRKAATVNTEQSSGHLPEDQWSGMQSFGHLQRISKLPLLQQQPLQRNIKHKFPGHTSKLLAVSWPSTMLIGNWLDPKSFNYSNSHHLTWMPTSKFISWASQERLPG